MARGLRAAQMLATAAEVGYSETVFVTADDGDGNLEVRYFSPEDQVEFCGHATIAVAVAHTQRHGLARLQPTTAAGWSRSRGPRTGARLGRDADERLSAHDNVPDAELAAVNLPPTHSTANGTTPSNQRLLIYAS